jgi:indolepyruvate ferredoxin oxidoreductase beta subunit
LSRRQLVEDPLNLVVTGVAGQGNVVISQMLGNALVSAGYKVVFGQSFGSNQRGGSVRNYLRISEEVMYSPIVPAGNADIIVSMEPVEALRMLTDFGNPSVITLLNPRVLSARNSTIDMAVLLDNIRKLSARLITIEATGEALKLGNSMLGNIILVGAIIGIGLLPVTKDAIIADLKERFPRAVDMNLRALDRGLELVRGR